MQCLDVLLLETVKMLISLPSNLYIQLFSDSAIYTVILSSQCRCRDSSRHMQVMARLLSKQELAWEGDLAEKNSTARHRLGLFREPILSLLHRDPAQRASLAEFCKTTNNVFSSPTTVVMP